MITYEKVSEEAKKSVNARQQLSRSFPINIELDIPSARTVHYEHGSCRAFDNVRMCGIHALNTKAHHQSTSRARMSERYRAFGLSVTPLPDRSMLVFNRLTGATHRLNTAEQNLLRFCATPRSLDEHAAAYLSQEYSLQARQLSSTSGLSVRRLVHAWAARRLAAHPPTEAAFGVIAEVNAMLERFAGNDLLASDSNLRAAFTSGDRTTPFSTAGISTVAISTSERPSSLKRLLESLAHNCQKFGHSPIVFVADDSRSHDAIHGNRRVLAEIDRSSGVRNVHLTRSGRLELAKMLADEAQVDLNVIRFGLLGDEALGPTYGAARNTLLLAAAGRLSIQLDDDIVCRLSNEDGGAKALSIDSAMLGEYHFFEDLAGCTAAHPEADVSLLDLHGEMLGRNVQECIAGAADGAVHIADLSVDLYRRLALRDVRIGVTSMGISGASGMERPEQRLFLLESSHKRLVASEVGFRKGLTTDYLVRTPTTWSISDGGFFMAAGTGFDLRDVLPPFSPSLRNEDGAYSATIHTCSPLVLQGLLPFTLLHAPPEHRSHSAITAKPLRVNDIIRRIIYGWQPSSLNTVRAHGYEPLGRYLVELSTLKLEHFRELVHDVVRGALVDDLTFLQRRIDEESGEPEYWARQVREYQSALMRAAEAPEYFAPADLRGDVSVRLSTLQAYIGMFGQLVQCWQQLFHAARRVPLDQLTLHI